MHEFLPNKEIELSEQTDFFGHLRKANAIKVFLSENIKLLESNKMFALYGTWGSGKSTVINYLSQELQAQEFVTISFRAWEHENDENLALSLADCIRDKLPKDIDTAAFMKTAFDALKNIGKGISLKTTVLNVDFGKMISSTEDDIKKLNDELSYHLKIQKFKERFEQLETQILSSGKKKIIVFIDDLDRCLPENVLSLLSSIKLFFTFGKNTVFFLGVDKDSINKAVKNRYGSTLEPEGFLEKIFDITFNLPQNISLHKLIRHYFPYIKSRVGHLDATYVIESFLKEIRFTNPRHLKKVFNKYLLLLNYKYNSKISTEFRNLIPDIISEHDQNNTLETILVLYFIILFEFYPSKLNDLERYTEKMAFYSKKLKQTYDTENKSAISLDSIERLTQNEDEGVFIPNINHATLKSIAEQGHDRMTHNQVKKRYKKILCIFLPKEIENFDIKLEDEVFVKQFEQPGNEILTRFCYFLCNRDIKNQMLTTESQYKLWRLFEMVRCLL